MPPRQTARRRQRAQQLDAFASARTTRRPAASRTSAQTRRTLSAGVSPRATSRTGSDMGSYGRGNTMSRADMDRALAERWNRGGRRSMGSLAYAQELRSRRQAARQGRGGVARNARSGAYEAARFH